MIVRRGVTAVRILGAIVLIAIALVVAYFGGKWLWGELATYVRPDDATERKAHLLHYGQCGVV
jgi:hypothetical protein